MTGAELLELEGDLKPPDSSPWIDPEPEEEAWTEQDRINHDRAEWLASGREC